MEHRDAAASANAAMLELARASGLELSPQMLTVVLELLRQDVSPQGVVALGAEGLLAEQAAERPG